MDFLYQNYGFNCPRDLIQHTFRYKSYLTMTVCETVSLIVAKLLWCERQQVLAGFGQAQETHNQ